jgi:Helix-turn-helix domain
MSTIAGSVPANWKTDMDPIKRGMSVEGAARDACETASEPLGLRAFRIPEVCQISGLGRTSIYAAIKSGELVARKWNRCTIVLGDDLATFLNNLPKVG